LDPSHDLAAHDLIDSKRVNVGLDTQRIAFFANDLGLDESRFYNELTREVFRASEPWLRNEAEPQCETRR
jgi:hypothetical protein